MKKHSDETPDWEDQRNRIIGLGETSIHKSYYPELQRRLVELMKKNEELNAAYQQLAASEWELRERYNELRRREQELLESRESLQHAKEFTDKLIETANTMIIGLDLNGHITIFNKAATEITGYSPEDIEGRNWFDVIVPKDRYPEVREEFLRLVAGGMPTQFESPILTKSGEERYIVWRNGEIRKGDAIAGTLFFGIDITERRMAEEALNRTTKKLNLLNLITLTDFQNAVFSISGYLELAKMVPSDGEMQYYLTHQTAILQTINESLRFARQYQNLGLKPPSWQNVNQAFLFGISHLDFSGYSRRTDIDGLEIYADPLLEQVFFTLAENVVLHGKTATGITLRCEETSGGLTLVFEDNGRGIPIDMKDKIFDRRYEEKKGLGLFLTGEILSITGITIRETGEPGQGARFEIMVPKRAYRFSQGI